MYWRVLVDEDEEDEGGFIVDAADVVGRIEGRGKEVWEGLWWWDGGMVVALFVCGFLFLVS